MEILVKRAQVFKNNAIKNLKEGFLDIAVFNLKQAAQLLIKAKENIRKLIL